MEMSDWKCLLVTRGALCGPYNPSEFRWTLMMKLDERISPFLVATRKGDIVLIIFITTVHLFK